MLLRGVGTLRYFCPPNASVQGQPDGLTIHAKKWFLGAVFLGAPRISLTQSRVSHPRVRRIRHYMRTCPFARILGSFINILYYTILYYNIIYYDILYYTILYYTILYYTIIYYTFLCPPSVLAHTSGTCSSQVSGLGFRV